MEHDYIDELNHAYDQFFVEKRQPFQERRVPVLVIDTNHLDYVHDGENLRWVENRIRQSLRMHPFQTELPLNLEAGDITPN